MGRGIHNMYLVMLLASILAGLGSSMNIWADKWDDIYFNLNDVYMIGLMTGWMFFFMGLFTLDVYALIGGLISAIVFFIAIRKQWFINEYQFARSMIPHHSMAVMMTKRIRLRPNNIKVLINQIIQSQEEEIRYMKTLVDSE
jgi:hypothetical protein